MRLNLGVFAYLFIQTLLGLVFSTRVSAFQIVSNCQNDSAVEGEYLVRIEQSELNQSTSQKSFNPFHSDFEARKLGSSKYLSKPKNEKIAMSVDPAVEVYHIKSPVYSLEKLASTSGKILSVEQNCVIHSFALPNDPQVSRNLGLSLINAPKAWDVAKKSNAIVAIIDTGVEVDHPDLSSNIWQNTAELNGQPGVDDDKNGYVDDISGWGSPEHDADITSGNYEGADHGTHVAGIVGAIGNNGFGTSGVLWSAKLMPLRVFKKNANEATTADIIEAIYYAVNNGAQVINCSWGAEQTPSKAERDAYNYAENNGVLVVAAAGNEAKDASTFSPASIPTVFAVGSMNSKSQLSTFSNYGNSISILAPGGDQKTSFGTGEDEEIFSTISSGQFGFKRGTSTSAPYVSGVAALVRAILPKISPKNLRDLLKATGQKVQVKKQGLFISYPGLDAFTAVSMAASIAVNNPACSDNCILSGTANLSSAAPAMISRFGGGGCSAQNLENKTKDSATASADLAFILSAFAHLAVVNLKKFLKKYRR